MNSGLKSAAASGTAATVPEMMRAIGAAARMAEQALRLATTEQKNRALQGAAQALRAHHHRILEANELDMQEARERDLSGALLDRLKLDDKRIAAMATGLEDIAALADPIGTLLAEWQRPNGLRIQRDSRAAGRHRHHLREPPERHCRCRGAVPEVQQRGDPARRLGEHALERGDPRLPEQGLDAAGLPRSCIQLVPTADRAAVGFMLAEMTDSIDVIVPRGGRSLIERVQREARVPVIGHLEGVCHVYVDRDADLAMASASSSTQRCGARASAARPRRCSSTQRSPLLTWVRWCVR